MPVSSDSLSATTLALLGQSDITGDVLNTALRLAGAVSQFESNSNPQSMQDDGGPGRGMYQIEPESAKTAVNRMDQLLENVPVLEAYPWVQRLRDNGYDVVAADLTAGEQTELFLLDQLRDGDAPFIKTVKADSPSDWFDYWSKNWWRKSNPSDEETAHRRERWDRDVLPGLLNRQQEASDAGVQGFATDLMGKQTQVAARNGLSPDARMMGDVLRYG
mgnify:FL=1